MWHTLVLSHFRADARISSRIFVVWYRERMFNSLVVTNIGGTSFSTLRWPGCLPGGTVDSFGPTTPWGEGLLARKNGSLDGIGIESLQSLWDSNGRRGFASTISGVCCLLRRSRTHCSRRFDSPVSKARCSNLCYRWEKTGVGRANGYPFT